MTDESGALHPLERVDVDDQAESTANAREANKQYLRQEKSAADHADQRNAQRSTLFRWAIFVTSSLCIFTMGIMVWYMWGNSDPSPAVLASFFGSVVAQVVAIVLAMTQGLFRSKDSLSG